MDIAKSFTFMFEDADWLRKVGIGTLVVLAGVILSPILIGLVPLVMLLGYSLDVTRNVLNGASRPLPEWEDWGGFLGRGLKLAVVFIVWALPIVVVSIPLGLGSALLKDSNSGAVQAFGTLITVCGSCLTILWGLLLTLLSPAIYVSVAETDAYLGWV